MMAFTRRAQRTPGRRDGLRRLPARFGKRCRTSCREASWSTRPSHAMVASTFNLSPRESVRRGTETLKPHRALGPGEAPLVVQITLVGARQSPAGPDFTYPGP